MAIAQNSAITYADIRNLFDRVNAQRTRFGYTADTSGIPSQGSTANATTPNKLLTLLNGMSSHAFVGQFAKNSFSTVSAGTTITPGLLQNISNTLTTIESKTYFVSNDSGRCAPFNFCSPYGNSFITTPCNPYGDSFVTTPCNPYGESGFGTYGFICATFCNTFNFFSRSHFGAYDGSHFGAFSCTSGFYSNCFSGFNFTYFGRFSCTSSFFSSCFSGHCTPHFGTFARCSTTFFSTCFSSFFSTHFSIFSRETTFFSGCFSGFNASSVAVRLNSPYYGRFAFCNSGFFSACFSGHFSGGFFGSFSKENTFFSTCFANHFANHFGTFSRETTFFSTCFSGYCEPHFSTFSHETTFFSSCFSYEPDGNGGRCTFCRSSFNFDQSCDSYGYFGCSSGFHSPYGSGNSSFFFCNPHGSGNSNFFFCNPYGTGCTSPFYSTFNNGFNSSFCISGFCPSFNGASFFNRI